MKSSEAKAWADEFWRRAGRSEPFPRSLERAVAWALPVAVVKLPRLWLAEAHSWLKARGINLRCHTSNRPLRACLVARAGHGLIFLDGSDPDDERRLSLAHEIAHYLADYLGPRREALETLGEGIRAVLDGVRPPSVHEQLNGVLRGVTLGTFQHLIERSAEGSVTSFAVLQAEDRADRLALELLAPGHLVLEILSDQGLGWHDPRTLSAAGDLLVQEFGLPRDVADNYGRTLVMSCREPVSFRQWLRAEKT